MTNRWQQSAVPRGDDYDERWRSMAAAGENIHGEADLIEALLAESGGRTILDAGCGTGRVAIELARRGFTVTGVDADPAMLQTARANASELTWIESDLADPDIDCPAQDLVVLAGNVMIFLEPGSEGTVLANLANRLIAGGLLVAGFALQPGRLSLTEYDLLAERVGLLPVGRWATWDRQPFGDGDYVVSVHRAVSGPKALR